VTLSDSLENSAGVNSWLMMSLALEPEEISFPISGFVTRILRIKNTITAKVARTFPRDLRSDLKVAMLHQSLSDACTEEVQDDHHHCNGNKRSANGSEILKNDPLPQEETDASASDKTDDRG